MEELKPQDNKIINGTEIANAIKLSVRKEIVDNKLTPGLSIILIGNDEASHIYVNLKEKACHAVGITFNKYLFSANDSESEIIDTINFLNNDEEVDAIIVQLPLPKKFDTQKIINTITPHKDVDGFHPENIKKLLEGNPTIEPVMNQTIREALLFTKQNLENKTSVILGNSHEFIEPIEKMLELMKIKTTHTHISDINWQEKTSIADILITAVGEPLLINKDQIKKNVIIIDVGINKVMGATVGDVNYTDVFPKCSYITPVPGGIGPVTIAYLLKNTVELYKNNHK